MTVQIRKLLTSSFLKLFLFAPQKHTRRSIRRTEWSGGGGWCSFDVKVKRVVVLGTVAKNSGSRLTSIK